MAIPSTPIPVAFDPQSATAAIGGSQTLDADLYVMNQMDMMDEDVSSSGNLNYQELELKIDNDNRHYDGESRQSGGLEGEHTPVAYDNVIDDPDVQFDRNSPLAAKPLASNYQQPIEQGGAIASDAKSGNTQPVEVAQHSLRLDPASFDAAGGGGGGQSTPVTTPGVNTTTTSTPSFVMEQTMNEGNTYVTNNYYNTTTYNYEYNNTTTTTNNTSTVTNTVTNTVDNVLDHACDLVGDTLITIQNVLGDTLVSVDHVVGDVTGLLEQLLNHTFDLATDLTSDLTSILNNTTSLVGDILHDPLTLLTTVLHNPVDGVTNLLGDVLGQDCAIVDTLGNLLDPLHGVLDGLHLDAILDDPVGGVTGLLGDALGGGGLGGLGDLLHPLDGILDGGLHLDALLDPGHLDLGSLATSLTASLGDLGLGVGIGEDSILGDVLDGVGNALDSLSGGLLDSVGDTLGSLGTNVVGGLVDQLTNGGLHLDVDSAISLPGVANVSENLDVDISSQGIEVNLAADGTVGQISQDLNLNTLFDSEGLALTGDSDGTLTGNPSDLASAVSGTIEDLPGALEDFLGGGFADSEVGGNVALLDGADTLVHAGSEHIIADLNDVIGGASDGDAGDIGGAVGGLVGGTIPHGLLGGLG